MRAVVLLSQGKVGVRQVPDSRVVDPTDVVVRVTDASICGSDLHWYNGNLSITEGQRGGHEFIGVVQEVGPEVTRFKVGDRVLAPFIWSDGRCRACRHNVPANCENGGIWGLTRGSDGGQGEAVRVPLADTTLLRLPPDAGVTPQALLPLCDVLATGYHAAITADVSPRTTVAVIGDGAVGLCAVVASKLLGAEAVVLVGRHEARFGLGLEFGATVVVKDGVDVVADVSNSLSESPDVVLECVGSPAAVTTAMGVVRPGGTVSSVGVPHLGAVVDLFDRVFRGVRLVGGLAPANAYAPTLLGHVIGGRIDPSPIYDMTVALDQAGDGYAAMADRRALKVHIRVPGTE